MLPPPRHQFHSKHHLNRPSVLTIAVLSLLLSPTARPLVHSTQQGAVAGGAVKDAKDIRQIEPGKTIERELAGGESHTYRITLEAGQFLHAEIEQRGIDVIVTLAGPGGEKLAVVYLQRGTLGIEPVWWEAQKAGGYRLEVHAVSAKAEGGKYVLRSEVRGVATAQDRDRQGAERLLLEARELVQEGSAESQRRATAKREQALGLWRKVSDRYWEAYTLNNIGNVYNDLGEKQKALEFYNQALLIRKAIGDRGGEADTLNNIGNVYNDLGEQQKALEFYNQALDLPPKSGHFVKSFRPYAAPLNCSSYSAGDRNPVAECILFRL